MKDCLKILSAVMLYYIIKSLLRTNTIDNHKNIVCTLITTTVKRITVVHQSMSAVLF